MRFFLALLLSLALTLLPIGGPAMASEAPMSCHDMSQDDLPSNEQGAACAEHCMMQVQAPHPGDHAIASAIVNVVAAKRATLIDARAPRAADPPETPPPRG